MKNSSRTVGLLFGGRSAEHEVSLVSARNVRSALEEAGFDVVPIAVGRDGAWYRTEAIDSPEALPDDARQRVVLIPGGFGKLVALNGSATPAAVIDVAFPVLHGPYGEDGTVQGLFKLAGVPFVGPGVLGSAVAMDKDVCKRLLRDAGIPITDFFTFGPEDAPDYETVAKRLGATLFVKPANLGSSVGVSKVHDKAEFEAATALAFRFDDKILVEEDAEGREVECAVLAGDPPRASLPGEIVPAGNHGFYSYDAKYVEADGAALHAPAALPEAVAERVRSLSLEACRALCCEGMARVDFFLKANGDLLVNEVNTIPGFTAISMYPKLWEVSGLPPAELVAQLVDHAVDRFEREAALETTRHP